MCGPSSIRLILTVDRHDYRLLMERWSRQQVSHHQSDGDGETSVTVSSTEDNGCLSSLVWYKIFHRHWCDRTNPTPRHAIANNNRLEIDPDKRNLTV